MQTRPLSRLAVIGVLALSASGSRAQDAPNAQPATPQQPVTSEPSQAQAAPPPHGLALAGTYRGAMVCEQAVGASDILHVPFDLAVHGEEAVFARPLFDLRGSRVLGSEIGFGAIDASGAVHLVSTWEFGGVSARGEYAGQLTASGGVLTGAQSWRGRNDLAGSRVCQIALVSVVDAAQKPAD